MTLPISLMIIPDGPVSDVAELARLAEERDLARIWVADEGLNGRDVYVTLAAMVARTERIPMGPGITNPFVRHPGATATAIASLDELSGGRAFLGLGAGGALTLGPLGIQRTRPVASVESMIGALRRLFAGERVDQEGDVFSFQRATLGYARPTMEIIVAGRGPRMTAMAGRMADGFNLSYIHRDLLGAHTKALRELTAGRPFRISYATMLVTNDAELEEARAQMSFRLVDSPSEVKDLIGMTEADTDRIRGALAEGGPRLAARFVDPDWLPSLVLMGTIAECSAELAQLMTDNDIDEYQLPIFDIEGAPALIERTAKNFVTPENSGG